MEIKYKLKSKYKSRAKLLGLKDELTAREWTLMVAPNRILYEKDKEEIKEIFKRK